MTPEQAVLIVEKFDILDILENDTELFLMAEYYPDLLDAFYALVRLAGY